MFQFLNNHNYDGINRDFILLSSSSSSSSSLSSSSFKLLLLFNLIIYSSASSSSSSLSFPYQKGPLLSYSITNEENLIEIIQRKSHNYYYYGEGKCWGESNGKFSYGYEPDDGSSHHLLYDYDDDSYNDNENIFRKFLVDTNQLSTTTSTATSKTSATRTKTAPVPSSSSSSASGGGSGAGSSEVNQNVNPQQCPQSDDNHHILLPCTCNSSKKEIVCRGGGSSILGTSLEQLRQTFLYFKKSIPKPLQRFNSIYINLRNLKKLPKNIFQGLKFSHIFLSGSDLTYIDRDAFIHTELNIYTIFIYGTNLSSIPSKSINPSSSTSSFQSSLKSTIRPSSSEKTNNNNNDNNNKENNDNNNNNNDDNLDDDDDDNIDENEFGHQQQQQQREEENFDFFSALKMMFNLQKLIITQNNLTEIPDRAFALDEKQQNEKYEQYERQQQQQQQRRNHTNYTMMMMEENGNGNENDFERKNYYQLTEIQLTDGNIQKIGRESFYSLKHLEQLQLQKNHINHINAYAFRMQFPSNQTLIIDLTDNDLDANSFELNAFSDAKRPIKIHFGLNGCNQKLQYLPEEIFKTFLEENPKNSIDIGRHCFSLKCNCNMAWTISEKYRLRIKNFRCMNEKNYPIYFSEFLNKTKCNLNLIRHQQQQQHQQHQQQINEIFDDTKSNSNSTLITLIDKEFCSTKKCSKLAIEMSYYLNRSINPCDSFYDFACNGFESKHLIEYLVQVLSNAGSEYDNFVKVQSKIEDNFHKLLKITDNEQKKHLIIMENHSGQIPSSSSTPTTASLSSSAASASNNVGINLIVDNGNSNNNNNNNNNNNRHSYHYQHPQQQQQQQNHQPPYSTSSYHYQQQQPPHQYPPQQNHHNNNAINNNNHLNNHLNNQNNNNKFNGPFILPIENCRKMYTKCIKLAGKPNFDALNYILMDIGGWPLLTKKFDRDNYRWELYFDKILNKYTDSLFIELESSIDENHMKHLIIKSAGFLLSSRKLLSVKLNRLESYANYILSTLIHFSSSSQQQQQQIQQQQNETIAEIWEMIKFEKQLADIAKKNFGQQFMIERKLETIGCLINEIDWLYIFNKIYRKHYNNLIEIKIPPKKSYFHSNSNSMRNPIAATATTTTTTTTAAKMENFHYNSSYINYSNSQESMINEEDRLLKSKTIFNINYLIELSKLLRKTDQRIIANYIGWRIIDSIGYLIGGQQFQEIQQNFYTTESKEGLKSIKKQCLDPFMHSLPYLMTRLYVEKYFQKPAYQEAKNIIDNVKKSFINSMRKKSWIRDNYIKSELINKIENVNINLAYPDWILDNENLEILYNNLNYTIKPNSSSLSLLKFYTKVQETKIFHLLQQIGEKINKTDYWDPLPLHVGATYDFVGHLITMPLGLLQPPFFEEDRPAYFNYAALGSFFGHEMAHSVAPRYTEYDHLMPPWNMDFLKEYLFTAQCFVSQYTNYYDKEAELHLDGTRTFEEDMSDLTGIQTAYYAYQNVVKKILQQQQQQQQQHPQHNGSLTTNATTIIQSNDLVMIDHQQQQQQQNQSNHHNSNHNNHPNHSHHNYHQSQHHQHQHQHHPNQLQSIQRLQELPEFSTDMLFFISFAQKWCRSSTHVQTKIRIQRSVHSPEKYRVNGALSNFDSFAKTFNCPPGSPMNPSKRCDSW